MKITPEQIVALRELIAPLNTEEERNRYRTGRIINADKVKDLNKRYRWDLFWAVRGMDVIGCYDGGLKDSHIDTALRKIVTPL